MKYLLSSFFILCSACVSLGLSFNPPDLTRVHNTYTISESTFDVIVSKDIYLSLQSVCLQINDKKVLVPAEELKNIGWPHLDKIVVTKEMDLIYVKIAYGQELPGIKNHLQQVSFAFKNGLYASRERIVPTKQVYTEEEIDTAFQYFTKLPGKEEEKSGTGGAAVPRRR